jgi:predicted branched-subunit amino acid permease
MDRTNNRLLFLLLTVYAAASLVHFVHNAEFLGDYPGLPDSWSRGGVYFAWVAMTAVGALGALLVYRAREAIGLLLLAVYAALGVDSLGHYVVAPVSAHSSMMNATILLEVGAAALVFLEVTRRLFGLAMSRRARESSRRL